MDVMLLMDVIIFGCGIYMVYSAVMMKQTGQLSSWLRGPGAVRDEAGYTVFITGRTMVLGFAAIVFAAVQFVHNYVTAIPEILSAVLLLFFTVCLWFFANMARAKQKFW